MTIHHFIICMCGKRSLQNYKINIISSIYLNNLMKKISLVIPCYKVKDQILNVLKNLPYEIFDKIYIIFSQTDGDMINKYIF